MADLGVAVLKMTADARPLLGDLDKLKGKMHELGQGGFGTKAMAGVGGLLAQLTAGTGAASMFSGAMAGLAGPTGLVASVAGQAAGGLMSILNASEANIASQASLARHFGLTSQQAAALTFQASVVGESAETMQTALTHASRMLGDAAFHGGDAAQALRRLGLDARALASGPLTQSLGQIVDRINALGNANERAAVGFQLFGRQWENIQHLMRGGSAAMEQARISAIRLGIAVSDEDMRAAQASHQQLARGWATFRAGVGGGSHGLLSGARNILGMALEGWGLAAADAQTGIGFLLRSSSNFIHGHGFQDNAHQTELARQASLAAQHGMNAEQWAQTQAAMAASVRQTLDSLNQQAQAAGLSAQAFQLLQLRLQGATQAQLDQAAAAQASIAAGGALRGMEQQTDALREQIATFGMSAREIADWRDQQAVQRSWEHQMSLPFGTREEVHAQVEAADRTAQLRIQAQITAEHRRTFELMQDEARIQRQVTDQALQLANQVQDPLTNFQNQIRNLQDSFSRGGIGWEELGRGGLAALEQLERATGGGQAQLPGALTEGSSAAVSAINRWRNQGSAQDIQERIRQLLERAEQIQRDQLRRQDEMARQMKRSPLLRRAHIG
jgi:hypothetical protein